MFGSLINIIKDHKEHWHQILHMSKVRRQRMYKGSDLGWIWAFAKPILYMCVFYFAISIGFKGAKDIQGIHTPYFIWLISGIVPWFYIRDMIMGGAGCFVRNKYLVNRMKYPSSTIPAIVSLSYFKLHVLLMCIVFVLALVFQVKPSVYWLQIPFYTFFMVLFSTIWGMATGLLTVITRDFFNLLGALGTAIFWLSGILFDIHGVKSHAMQTMFLFNPVTYIVEGYRDSICRGIWFFEKGPEFGCYMIVLFVFLFIAIWLYRKTENILPDII